MANSLTPLSPTYWSKTMGIKLYKQNVFMNLVSRREEAVLTDGEYVDRPYRADISVENYTKGTALTAQDLTATSDKLQVDKAKAMLMYVDSIDKIQNKWDAAKAWTDEASTRLSNIIDAEIAYNVFSSNDTVDANDLDSNVTAGEGISLTSSNVLNMFTTTARKLDVANVPSANRFFVISPQVKQVLLTYLAGKESALGDRTGESGNIGRYMGFDLYESNNLTGSARWTPADNPSNSATITINGVVFTFLATPGSTAGAIDIGGTTAATIDNLVALINAGGVGDDTNNVSLSAADKRIVQNWVAVDGATYIEVRAKGASYMTLATSEAADVWTTTYQKQNLIAGEKKAIDLVIQKEPGVEMASTVSAGKLGMNIIPWTLFGTKTFEDMKARILRVEVRSDAY